MKLLEKEQLESVSGGCIHPSPRPVIKLLDKLRELINRDHF